MTLVLQRQYFWETMMPFLKLHHHWVYLSLFPSYLRTTKYCLRMYINPTTNHNTTSFFTSICNNLLAKTHPNIHIISTYVSTFWTTMVLPRHVTLVCLRDDDVLCEIILTSSLSSPYPISIISANYEVLPTYTHNPTTHDNTALTY